MSDAAAGPVWRVKVGLGDAELDGERVLWDPATGQLARLDRIGSLVWTSLDGVTPIAELVADLADAFGAPPAAVRADVDDLLLRLSELGLVTEQADGPT
ncbi:MAG: PqqD family protein [Acidimicrobiales bacterium]